MDMALLESMDAAMVDLLVEYRELKIMAKLFLLALEDHPEESVSALTALGMIESRAEHLEEYIHGAGEKMQRFYEAVNEE